MTNLERALLVAEKAHGSQMYDVYPYMYHVKEVVRIAESCRYSEDIIIACALHDTLEDTSLSYDNIKKHFGKEVAEIVYCVTDEIGRNRKERKEKTYPKIKNNPKAVIVKLCDRIANVHHSKKHNKKLFKMYQDEHDEFCEGMMLMDDILNSPHTATIELWEKLDDLIKDNS